MSSGGVFQFSDILKLKSANANFEKGCIVDTSILFAVSYPNDAHYTAADEVFEFLHELKMPAFSNSNIRSEFINNQFQVMVPEGLADFYSAYGTSLNEVVYKKLQSNYTFITEAKKNETSYKFSTTQINTWRNFLRANSSSKSDPWFDFCSSFINHRVEAVWESTCNEVGINFLSLRGSDKKDWQTGPIDWHDMSLLVGKFGIGSFDAMIINLFLNSHFPALLTADKEIAKVVEALKPKDKFVFLPDKLRLI